MGYQFLGSLAKVLATAMDCRDTKRKYPTRCHLSPRYRWSVHLV
ncbi:Uncharacterised protein [Vibrio cholerae]|nr:Uncharacterised protein [Vibrio cholerae]